MIEGRDIGSVVFPEAELKVYLTASEDVRAQRRHKEAADLDYEQTRALIADRDAFDSSRADSPLREADGAVTRRHDRPRRRRDRRPDRRPARPELRSLSHRYA